MSTKKIESKEVKFDTKVDLVKAARLAAPKSKTPYVMHPQEPDLAIMLLTGEINQSQVRAALKATGLKQPHVTSRMFRAIQVAYDKGLVKESK